MSVEIIHEELDPRERTLLDRLYPQPPCVIYRVRRRGENLYDLVVEGESRGLNDQVLLRFQAWLPLAVIHYVWLTSAERRTRMAHLRDAPTVAGDWSAIRDASPAALWQLFITVALPHLLPSA